MSDASPDRDRAYWRANLRLLLSLLAVWALCGFGLSIFFVEPLNEVKMGGFPLGFWFAQQGSIYVFIVLTLIYAIAMDRIEARHRAERDASSDRGDA